MPLPARLARLHAAVRAPRPMRAFTVACRVLLALAFLPSGWTKLAGHRFTQIGIEHPIGFFFEALYRTGPYYRFIGAGQVIAALLLLVPRTAQMDNDVSSHVADNAQVSLAPEITTRRTTVKARKGESVASIASRYGVAEASVANWNNVNAQAAFKRGQQVVLHLPITARALVSAVVKKPAPPREKTAVQAVRRDAGKAVVKSKRK